MDLLTPGAGLIFWQTLALINIVLFAVSLIVILLTKRFDSKEKLVWLLGILFLPIIAPLIFLTRFMIARKTEKKGKTDHEYNPTEKSKLIEMNNVGIVVKSLDHAVSFFLELGLKLEGRMMVRGEWAGRVTGLGNQSVEVAMMVTPDGHSRLELSQFIEPDVVSDHRMAPVNSLGYLRVMFRVNDLDELLPRLANHGAEVVGEIVNYENIYRLCYIRGVEGLLIGLAEQLGTKSVADVVRQ